MEIEQFMIDHTLAVAVHSPCRSRRGVALFDMRTGAFRGDGFNGPPAPIGCPGRAVCAGTCGQRSVHAEVRALREARKFIANGHPPGPYDLIHVELAADGGVVACDGPSCPGCAAQILDAGFIGGVWLYEVPTEEELIDHERRFSRMAGWATSPADPPIGIWRRYTAAEFYEVTMRRVSPSRLPQAGDRRGSTDVVSVARVAKPK